MKILKGLLMIITAPIILLLTLFVLSLIHICIATHVNIDFHKIAFDVKKSLYNRLKNRLQKKGQITNRYIKEKYGTSREVRYLNGHAIVPIAYVQHLSLIHI